MFSKKNNTQLALITTKLQLVNKQTSNKTILSFINILFRKKIIFTSYFNPSYIYAAQTSYPAEKTYVGWLSR